MTKIIKKINVTRGHSENIQNKVELLIDVKFPDSPVSQDPLGPAIKKCRRVEGERRLSARGL